MHFMIHPLTGHSASRWVMTRSMSAEKNEFHDRTKEGILFTYALASRGPSPVKKTVRITDCAKGSFYAETTQVYLVGVAGSGDHQWF